MARSKLCAKDTMRGENQEPIGVVMKWVDGTKLEVLFADLSESLQAHAMAHGLKQKLGDSFAGARSVEEAKVFAQAVAETLTKEGTWNKSGRSATGGIWAEALARLTGRDLAECVELLQDSDEAQVKAIKADLRIKKAKAEIEAERAQAALAGVDNTTDLDDLF